MKKVFKNIVIGALIGLSTSYIIMTFTLLSKPTNSIDGKGLLLQLTLALILGIICGLISLIFEVERIPFFAKLIIHYIIILAAVLVCGAIGNWYEAPTEDPISFFSFLVIQLVIYIVIFIGDYISNLLQLKKINERLRNQK